MGLEQTAPGAQGEEFLHYVPAQGVKVDDFGRLRKACKIYSRIKRTSDKPRCVPLPEATGWLDSSSLSNEIGSSNNRRILVVGEWSENVSSRIRRNLLAAFLSKLSSSSRESTSMTSGAVSRLRRWGLVKSTICSELVGGYVWTMVPIANV